MTKQKSKAFIWAFVGRTMTGSPQVIVVDVPQLTDERKTYVDVPSTATSGSLGRESTP